MPAGVISERAFADHSEAVSLRDGGLDVIKTAELAGRLQCQSAMVRLCSTRLIAAMILILRIL